MEAEDLTFQFLQEITDDFSEERKLGEGAYGVVYKGVTKNGDEVAVKKLRVQDNLELNDNQFRNEFYNLTMLKHQNIVQFLGYCYETKQTPMEFNGRTVLAEERYRALCFEYLHNGSLGNYLSDEFRGFDWHTRYRIIKGTWEGLQYLHEGTEKPIYHLDLKPDNILLDKDMVPKIADFGLSTIIGGELKQTSQSLLGTLGYQPPEHIEEGEISNKFDIFSLGVVMLKIISGPEGYSKCAYMTNDAFVDHVQNNWRNRLQATWSDSVLDAYCYQVEICTQIALNCVEKDSQKRPDIMHTIKKFNEIETYIGKIVLLQVEPLQLQFSRDPNNSTMSCSLQLTNNTENQVIFRLVTNRPEHFLWPICGVVPSRCTNTLTVTRFDNLLEQLSNGAEFLTLESSIAGNHKIKDAISNNVDIYNSFFAEAKENGHEIHHVKLTSVYKPKVQGKTITQNHQRTCSKIFMGVTNLNKELLDQNQNFDLTTTAKCNDLVFADTRETLSDCRGDLILGRAKEKNKIIALLRSSIEKVTILAIHGIGGIGKTTFAKLIYNDFKEYSCAWVYVSPRFDLNRIGNSIISQLSGRESQSNERQEIHSCLRNLFNGKKIMIVLDDLWEDNTFHLEDLKGMLSSGDSMNTIVLVTTRSKSIAKKISNLPYRIEDLTDDLCWDIIKQRSGFYARYDKEKLIGIGKEIARKCRGVALAAQSLGFMLYSMTSDQWMQVKDNDIYDESCSDDASQTNHVLSSLKLTYDSMPPNLKLCFAYCALFPRGYKIVKDDLCYQWISLGFIKPTKLLSVMQLCEKYTMQLLGLSFFHHSVATFGTYKKDVTLFTMHDLVYDLARFVTADKILDASKHAITGECSYWYASLTDCTKPLDSYTCYPDKIRALRFVDCGQIILREEAFSCAKSLHLQVLDLSECRIDNLPASVSKLAELRYLNAQKIQGERIPWATRWSRLIYLNLSGSAMTHLPESIGEIKGLMYLDISYCSRISYLPKSFANLKKLVHLNLSNCTSLLDVDSLYSMANLQYLNLSLPGKSRGIILALYLQEYIVNFIELRYLNLSYFLRYMFLGSDGTSHLSSKMFSFFDRFRKLSNLEHLDLSHNSCLVSLPESIGNLSKLHTLDLSFCINLVRLPKSMARLNSLKIINVAGCSRLDKSVFSQSKIAALLSHFTVHTHEGESNSNIGMLRQSNPEELHICSLDNVKSVEEVHSIELMEKWRINDLKFEWTRDAQRSVEDVELLGELVPPRTLRKFSIKCYNSVGFPAWVMDMKTYLPNLVKIVLCDLYECKSLPPLGQLLNLQELVVEGMDSVTAIEEGFCGGTRAFPQLTKFRLCRMKNLEVWNTIYPCGNDNDGVQEFMFPNLHELSICNCSKLKLKQCPPRAQRWEIESSDNVLSSWGEWGKTCLSTAQTDVKLSMKSMYQAPMSLVTHAYRRLRLGSSRPATKCCNLESKGGQQTCTSSSTLHTNVVVKSTSLPLHQWMLFYHLPAITELRIIRCGDLSCNSEKFIGCLSSIESLWLEDNTHPKLPKWLCDLKCLRELIIRRCTALSDLHEGLRHLPFLQLLSLNECPQIPALPIPKLGSLASLKELVIWDCRGIKSLPESILAKLNLLYIYDCPELAEWCKLHENRMMFRYSMDKQIILPNEAVSIPVVKNLIHQ